MQFSSVLITGANRGIGLEFVKQVLHLAEPPRHVFATYRNIDTAKVLQEIQKSAPPTVQVHLIKFDVRDSNDLDNLKKVVEDAVGEQGLTLLINNAGIAQRQKFPDVTVENLNVHFQVNTVGPILVAQTLLPLLKKAAALQPGSGKRFCKAGILNISSVIGSIADTGVKLMIDLSAASYKISKAALNMSMRVMAASMKDDDILIVNMCPGWVKTDMGTNHAEITPEESIAAMLDTIAKLNETHHGAYLDRFGNPIPW